MISVGGSVSDRVCRISADITGLPVCKTQANESSAHGCAMLTYMGLGTFKTPQQAISHMVHDDKCYMPDMNNHDEYMQIYHTGYERIDRKIRKTSINVSAYNRKYPDTYL